MKRDAVLAILPDMLMAFEAAFLPTLKHVLLSPGILFRPYQLSQIFMSHVWELFSDSVDECSSKVKKMLVTSNARGVVLDIGAGRGHTAQYLDRAKVTKYIALEPNHHMHPHIRVLAAKEGYSESDGSLHILSCGAEDASKHLPEHDIDTIISILTLCSVPNPEASVRSLARDVLKPGGQFLFYEHVLSDRCDVRWWQRFWTPLWKLIFGGCRLDRPTHRFVKEAECWKADESTLQSKEGEEEDCLFWHQLGQFVKAT